jgi:DNA-binding CsgD family transcriptional regulator
MTKRGIALIVEIFMTTDLSERQKKVLKMTLKEHSKNYIATFLGVSPRTVTNDRKAIRIALRPYINVDSLQETLLQVFHEFDLNWRKTNRIIYNSSNDYTKLRALNMQQKIIEKKIDILRTLGFITTKYEKDFFEQKKK